MVKNKLSVLAAIIVTVVVIAGGCTGDTTAPAAPTLVSPADAYNVIGESLNLEWDDVTDPSGVTYEVQVDDTDATFNSLVVDESGLETNNYTLDSVNGGTYYWRARAVDGATLGNAGDWSTVRSFVKAVEAKSGDTVSVHYTGTLDDGTVFDSSIGGDTLQFTIGNGEMIPGFEQAVTGMKIGESKTVKITADEAYGPHQEDLVFTVALSEVPENIDPQVGQLLGIEMADGSQVYVLVTEVTESYVTLDANHPLAGKDLTFEIHLVEIM
ncbi:FKBP-type peptidyl-prolyl cis-trans isomerase [Chloroflexota bacterium]